MSSKTQETNHSQPEALPKVKINATTLKKSLRIFQFMFPYAGWFALGMLFLVFSTFTALSFPYLAGKLIDVATGKNLSDYFPSIQRVSLILFGVLLLQSFFSFIRIWIFANVTERTMAQIRQKLYNQMISLHLSFFEQRRIGELTSRLTSDVATLQDTLAFTLAEFFRQIATLIVGISVLLWISTQLTLLMVATFPVVIVIAMFFGKYIRKLAKKAQDELAQANVVVEETLQSILSVKSFTNEWYESQRYQNSLQSVVRQAIKAALARGLFASFIIFAIFGAIVVVLAYGASLVAAGQISIGELTSFIIYTAFIGGAVGGLGEMYGQIQKTLGSTERILEILDEKPEIDLATTQQNFPRLQGNIRFENVYFAYPTRPDVMVLKGIDLQIEAGQKVALVGQSGAGKTTITQLLAQYYPLNQGSIWIDNQPIQYLNLTHLRQNIGLVPQEVLLFGGTIEENIRYGKPSATFEEIQEAAQRANALQFIQSFPEGFKTIVGERGVKLSGGQRQRIAIARAILKNPAILVLDEATSSLDADSEKLVQEALDELMKNRTTIIIAHRLATIRKVDKIYVLHEGKIVEQGTHDQLLQLHEGIYQNLVKLQFELN
ncbi:MAG: ABC transporter transmembrane domain-containing protein [Microscillaceae bacterium]|nr:ABC transporter transmembrane domain-containing protein [Microscillaceae bacterium]MDW8461321.1 ABC transporter transmembrane domain-containing protein [Cytophagales bacterium]